MKFVDEVIITARSGKGGNGSFAFLREKYRPHGGPAGGDGGKGGAIIFLADDNLNTLLDFRYNKLWAAEDGQNGKSKNQSGSDSEDMIVRVPPGTIVYDADSGEMLHDLLNDGDRWVALPGGKGGRGNQHFATPSNQAPTKHEDGEPAQERRLRLELKLMADVGLVGYPNAGKSTFLSRVSAAKPKIADYPFTTLVPNLGVVKAKGDRTFVIADIPGLIEGASEGVGLGIRFLKHIERTALFLHIVDFFDEADGGPYERFVKVEKELLAYDPTLKDRPALLAANKMDLPEAREQLKTLTKKFAKRKIEIFPISGVSGVGLETLVNELATRVQVARRARADEKRAALAKDAKGEDAGDAEDAE